MGLKGEHFGLRGRSGDQCYIFLLLCLSMCACFGFFFFLAEPQVESCRVALRPCSLLSFHAAGPMHIPLCPPSPCWEIPEVSLSASQGSWVTSLSSWPLTPVGQCAGRNVGDVYLRWDWWCPGGFFSPLFSLFSVLCFFPEPGILRAPPFSGAAWWIMQRTISTSVLSRS